MTMNQMPQAPTPQNPTPPSPVNPTPPPGMVSSVPPKKEGGSAGSITAVIFIVVLLAIGGLYYLMTEMNVLTPGTNEMLPTAEELRNSDDPDVQAAMTQSTSDEVSAIEADLEATDFSGIDSAMMELDTELAQ